MKRGPLSFSLFLVLVLSIGCSSAAPDAGHEAVLISKPFFIGSGGVDPNPVRTGRVYIALSTQAVMVDMRPQLFRVHLDDFFTKDGVPLDFDATMRLRVTSSVKTISEFGDDWYKKNIEPEFIRAVRNTVKKHGMNEAALNVTAADEMDNDVTTAMVEYIKEKQLPVELMEVTLGRANPPDAVKHQRIDTATQEQRQNTEQQRKLAEDQRKMAEESRAKADNAYRQAMQLSPDQFLRLETIKMQHDVCGKDKSVCTFFIGQGPTPVLPVR